MLIEFAYNNSYHSSIDMPPYESLYRRSCRSPVCRDRTNDTVVQGFDGSIVLGPEMIQSMYEKVQLIRERMKTAQSRQKSHANNSRKDFEFVEGDFVYLKVSPMKVVFRFAKWGELAPRYVDPYKVLKCIQITAYKLDLLSILTGIHESSMYLCSRNFL